MSVALTIRDVPDDVRDALAEEARSRGQSLQAFLLGVLRRQADFSRNARILVEVQRDLSAGGGAGAEAPDAADLLDAARGSHAGGGRARRSSPGSAA